jgi:hypothetical protein
VKNQFWLRSLAVSIGLTSLTTSQATAQYNTGLAPSAYPISIGSYPSIAQNAHSSSGHVHVPHANYTGNDYGTTLVPSQYQDTRGQGTPTLSQPANITPLPPVQSPAPSPSHPMAAHVQSSPTYSQPAQTYTQPAPSYMQSAPLPTHAVPMYSVPAPQATIVPHPIPMTAGDIASGSSCGGTISTYAAPTCQPAPMYVTRAVNPNPWILGAGAVIFNRQDNEHVRLTSSVQAPGAINLSTSDARMRTTGGPEVFLGRYFGGGRYAVVANYWGLYPTDQSRIIYDPENDTTGGDWLRTDLNMTLNNPAGSNLHGIEMPTGRSGYDWFNNTFAHRLVRGQDYNNVEVNFFTFALGGAARNGIAGGGGGGLAGAGFGAGHGGRATGSGWMNGQYGRGMSGGHGAGTCGDSCGDCNTCNSCQTCVPCNGPTGPCAPITGAQCSRLRLSLLGGLRWFRFEDRLEYASSDTDGVFGTGADDFYYRNTVRNDLVGFQLGGLANYCTGRRVNLYGTTKAGIFGNRSQFDSYAGTTTTPAVTVSQVTSYDNQQYIISNSDTSLAAIGECELGLGVRLTKGITGNCGYRVIGVSGLATAPGQIPRDFSILNDASRIQNDHSLILHGLSIGGMYNW